ncbi:MAG: TIGR03618 family F420-dependent PPOX class oxidoreductase [Dehalococcoidia bacterium]
MAAIPQSVRLAIEAGPLVHLVTLNRDSSPQVTVIWAGIEGDEIVTAHLGSQQKLKNIRHNARVALSMETGGHNAMGLAHYLVIHGRARIEEGGAAELLQRLARRYLGPDVKFPPMDNPPPGYVMHITPERFGGVGPWTSEPAESSGSR